VSEFSLIFAFRENEKRGFRFNPSPTLDLFAVYYLRDFRRQTWTRCELGMKKAADEIFFLQKGAMSKHPYLRYLTFPKRHYFLYHATNFQRATSRMLSNLQYRKVACHITDVFFVLQIKEQPSEHEAPIQNLKKTLKLLLINENFTKPYSVEKSVHSKMP
jgi:hypothetical protein